MKSYRLLIPLVFGVGVILIFAFTVSQGAQPVQAQSSESLWLSSADPPDGLPQPLFSPPDRPTANAVAEENLSPDALVSWRVTGSALKPRENNLNYTVGNGGACTYVTSGDAFTVWNTPLHLPQGTVVDTLRLYYYDTSASNSTAWFTIYDLYGSIVQEWSVSTSGSSGNSFNDSAVISHTIDYSVYNYLLNWRPNDAGSDIQLCGFRIFYDAPGPLVSFLPISPNESAAP